jgi:hypothetical protein
MIICLAHRQLIDYNIRLLLKARLVKKIVFLFILTLSIKFAPAQKVDSIYFNLYTDSLKKGTHNYINIDGKLSNGEWKPLSAKEIQFTNSYGVFEGNDLILPDYPACEKVTVKAVLKSNPQIWKEVTIWIKKKPDDERLKTTEEIFDDMKRGSKKNKRGKD